MTQFALWKEVALGECALYREATGQTGGGRNGHLVRCGAEQFTALLNYSLLFNTVVVGRERRVQCPWL